MGIFGIFGRVIVEGTSMQPTYNPLDWLLVHYGFFGKKYLFLRLGDVVVIERERHVALLVAGPVDGHPHCCHALHRGLLIGL